MRQAYIHPWIYPCTSVALISTPTQYSIGKFFSLKKKHCYLDENTFSVSNY
jgi:sorbitol-specific phosphotransferase system component IIC